MNAAGSWPVVHCCARSVPVGLIRRAGAVAVALDVALLDSAVLDELAIAVDDGLALWPGVVPSLRPDAAPSDTDLAEKIERLFRRLDVDLGRQAAGAVVTPTCGLAGADEPWSREAYVMASNTARAFAERVGAGG